MEGGWPDFGFLEHHASLVVQALPNLRKLELSCIRIASKAAAVALLSGLSSLRELHAAIPPDIYVDMQHVQKAQLRPSGKVALVATGKDGNGPAWYRC